MGAATFQSSNSLNRLGTRRGLVSSRSGSATTSRCQRMPVTTKTCPPRSGMSAAVHFAIRSSSVRVALECSRFGDRCLPQRRDLKEARPDENRAEVSERLHGGRTDLSVVGTAPGTAGDHRQGRHATYRSRRMELQLSTGNDRHRRGQTRTNEKKTRSGKEGGGGRRGGVC